MDAMERRSCSICGQQVPASNLELHESRCLLRQRRDTGSAGQGQQGGRARMNITEYNNAHSQQDQEFSFFQRWWSFISLGTTPRRRTFYLWLFLGLFVLSQASQIFARILTASGQIFLLTISGQNDFSVLEYYMRMFQPSSYYWLWPWQWALLLEYHASTMKCLNRFDVNECCSSTRRESFLRLFLEKKRGPPDHGHESEEEWLVNTAAVDTSGSGSSNNKVRFQSDAWYEATYDYLASYDFKSIVRGYDNVEWLISGYFNYHVPANQIELRTELGRKIRANADDFVDIVESLEWKPQDKRVWLDYCEGHLCSLVQWNAYTTDVEEQTRKLVGRIQCWDSVGMYLHDRIHSPHRQESSFRWENHPEMDFASTRCDERNKWDIDFFLEYPVCMAEVVKEMRDPQKYQLRSHTVITGAASHNLQCLMDEYQIHYDDCSSSWKNGNLMAGYNTDDTSTQNDFGAVEVAHLMKEYVYRETPIEEMIATAEPGAGVENIESNGDETSSLGSSTNTNEEQYEHPEF